MNYKKSTELNESKPLIRKYIQQSNYLTLPSEESFVTTYEILPEAYNIFTNLNDIKFNDEVPQEAIAKKCLLELRRVLMNFYKNYGVRKELPKTKYLLDEDNTIILSWEYSNYRLFLSFERDKDFGYLGMMIKNTEENISTNTSKVTNDNYSSLMNSVVEIMINN